MAMNTFVLETETHDGKKETHGAGVGGVPDMTAEQLGEHLTALDHFRGKMKKVTIKHRSALVKKDIAGIHRVKGKDLPPLEVVVHEHANSNHPDPENPPKEEVTEPEETPSPEDLSALDVEVQGAEAKTEEDKGVNTLAPPEAKPPVK